MNIKDVYLDYPNRRPCPVPIEQTTQARHFLMEYIDTFLVATFADFFTYPLDVTKTRLHLQGEAAEKAAAGIPKRGMFGTLFGMMREEGPSGLYSGLIGMVIRNLLFNAPRVVIYDYARQQLIYMDENGKEALPIMQGFLGGCLAGCLCQAIANPLDIVKIRMQMEGRQRSLGYPERVRNVIQALQSIYAQGGAKSLWKGVVPSCLRATLMTAGDTACYDLSKRQFITLLDMEDGRIIQFLASVSAGLAATILSTPVDVVKSRIMNQPFSDEGQGLRYRNALDCYYKLITQEGFFAMYKGFLPCWLRLGPLSIIFWYTFEQLRRVQGETGF
ncbi:mitochondrial uncoupling protein 4C-like [Drosophila montana]|uniref:mitochondrial uncoupling protein 4C-like n=1 Tax=Drosophila montana TaxID=40370 RepID=UPI00313A8332